MKLETPTVNLFSLTYVSSARVPFSTPDLLALLDVSRRNNAAENVTGMLLYHEGNFMQVLEGPEDAVRQAHARIAEDPRHGGLITLLACPVARRHFGEWSMGFRDLSDPALRKVTGFNGFLNGSSLVGAEFTDNPTHAHKLLLSFKKNL